MKTLRSRLTGRVATVAAITAVGVMALQGASLGDSVTNNLDNTIDATVESLSLTAGGANGSPSLSISPENGDGVNGCNVKNTASLILNVQSSNTSVATVSPSSVTFTACSLPALLTVTPKAAGTARVTVSIAANMTSGTFDLAPATFDVNVTGPANTAPTVALTGVTNGASYEFGNVPAAQCSVSDKEDGNSSFAAALSAITGPRAADGLGSRTAACSFTDKGGLSGTATATYSIVDKTAPAVTVRAPAPTEATGKLTPVTFGASASDAVDGTVATTCATANGKTYASGDGFPIGTTSLTCSATDKAGNTGTAAPFDVAVTDTTGPVLTTSANVTVPNTSGAGATVTYDAPTASDLVDGSVAASCTPASGTQFAMGATTVTCSATDMARNVATKTFTIEVQDKTKPIVTVPGNITAEATGPKGADVDYGSITADDDVDGPLGVSCDKPSGTFPVGTTTVTCSATDKSENPGSNSFQVTVEDTTPPELTLPQDTTAEATGPGGAAVTFSASADDIVDGDVSVDCDPKTGTTFPVATTPVVCTATDAHGNSASDSFTVTVRDTTVPEVSVPDDVVTEATGPDGARVSYANATAEDLVDGPGLSPACSQRPGMFPLGTTKVTCTAIDAAGNTGEASFTVKVVDTTAPTVNPPANLQVGNNDGANGNSAVTYGPATATDLVDGPDDETSCTPASGSAFPMGLTTVTCTATDAHHNIGTATFTVEVQDQTKPEVHVPSTITASATGPNGATATWPSDEVYAIDDVDGSLDATCDKASGDVFPLGETTVTCSATDHAGNPSDSTFTIKVVDDKAPVVSVPDNITAGFATSAKGTAVNFTASATDDVDITDTTTCVPASGSAFPVGTTTVTCTATDKAKNVASKSFTVTVNGWSGILSPVNADGSSSFKLGSTVPVKFSLTGPAVGIKNLDAHLYVGSSAAASTSAATPDNAFRYDASANQYVFNLATKALSAGTYQLRLDLGDGVEHTVKISLK